MALKGTILIFCLFSILNVKAQLNEDEKELVAYKAKLLTTSRYGLLDTKEKIILDITNQYITFLKSPVSRLEFLNISFDQKNTSFQTNTNLLWIGNCSYILAYNSESSKFYRLGGFENVDVSDFFTDLDSAEESILLDLNNSDNISIDFYCLKRYSELSTRKKRKRGFNCFDKCSEALKTIMKVH